MFRVALLSEIDKVKPHIEHAHGGSFKMLGLFWVRLNDTLYTQRAIISDDFVRLRSPHHSATGAVSSDCGVSVSRHQSESPIPIECVSNPRAARCSLTFSANAFPIMLSSAMSMS